jgi:hypothetical protein
MAFLEFMFQSFWCFVGCLILITLPIQIVSSIWKSFLRYNTMKRHGYPPIHCDADGQSILEEKEDEE